MEFPIAPSSTSTALVAGAIAILTIGIGIVFAWFAITASNLSASIDGDDLVIDVPFYGRSIPLSSLDVTSAQIVDIGKSDQLRPRIRTNGIGLPGYWVGWFRLRNGERALSVLTAKDGALYIRTSDGYSLLLSLVNSHLFLDQLIWMSRHGA